jgi:hypothetical protein
VPDYGRFSGRMRSNLSSPLRRAGAGHRGETVCGALHHIQMALHVMIGDKRKIEFKDKFDLESSGHLPKTSASRMSQAFSAISIYFRSPLTSFCSFCIVSLLTFRFIANSHSLLMSSEFFSASCFSARYRFCFASMSFVSRSL